jgi:transposase
MFNLSPTVRIFVCTKPTDMRRSFNGLFALVQNLIHEDPFAGHLFLFRSRQGDFIKIFWFDQDGFAIFAKKLEIGKFRFPDVRFVNGEYEPVEIVRADLMMLLEGIDTESAKRQKRYKREARDRGGNGHPQNGKNLARSPKAPTSKEQILLIMISIRRPQINMPPYVMAPLDLTDLGHNSTACGTIILVAARICRAKIKRLRTRSPQKRKCPTAKTP